MINKNYVKTVVKPILEQNKEAYVTSCCGRVYAGINPAATCRTCKKTPNNTLVTSLEEVEVLNF